MALRDEVSQHQIDRIKHYKAEHLLDFNVPKKTELITEGKWTLTPEDKDEALKVFFGFAYENAAIEMSKFDVDEHFINIINEAYLKSNEHKLINVKKPSLLDIKYFYEKDTFRIISVGETKDNKIILKNEAGIPLRNGDATMKTEHKESGKIVWSSNKGNINDFITAYKSAFNKNFYNPYAGNGIIPSLPSRLTKEHFDINLFNNFDLHLYITCKPEDMLNQSMSKFYQSCQTLYREEKGFSDIKPLMANLFDKNTKICYLIFDTPWTDHHGKMYPFTAFSRMFIRLHKGKIFFDCVYPNNLKNFLHKMAEKYTTMKNEPTVHRETYNYTTSDAYAQHSYMDILAPSWKKEVLSSELIKDTKLKTLSEYLKIEPTDIENHQKNVYQTQNSVYTIFTEEEDANRLAKDEKEYNERVNKFNKQVNDDTIKNIKDMVYKQDIYKNHIDMNEFGTKEKDKFLKDYNGDMIFGSISKWAEENKISKHNIYRVFKPYLTEDFWKTKLSDNIVDKKKAKYIEENQDKIPKINNKKMGEKLDIGDGLIAYK